MVKRQRPRLVFAWLLALCLALAACGGKAKKTETGRKPAPTKTERGKKTKYGKGYVQQGLATWYGGKFHGGPTASGETYNKFSMTAAHRFLPFNTRVKVTNLKNGRSVILRINNRGPFGNKRRIIDVSEAAARKLDMIEAGVVPVRVEVIQ